MVGTSKILTVSYGTFSCTLEGFDDPFSAMREIAEYFRDLAAEDRYFGAEPPTPDAETMARLAQRGAQRRVTARVGEQGIALRETASAPGLNAPGVSASAPVAPSLTVPEPQQAAPEMFRASPPSEAQMSSAPTGPYAATPAAQVLPQPGNPAEDFAAKMLRIRAAATRSAAGDTDFEEALNAPPLGFAPITAAFGDASGQASQPMTAQPPVAAAPQQPVSVQPLGTSFIPAQPASAQVVSVQPQTQFAQPAAVQAAPAQPVAEPAEALQSEPRALEGELLDPAAPAQRPAPSPVRLVRARLVKRRRAEALAEAQAAAEAKEAAALQSAPRAAAALPPSEPVSAFGFEPSKDEIHLAGPAPSATVLTAATAATAAPAQDTLAFVSDPELILAASEAAWASFNDYVDPADVVFAHTEDETASLPEPAPQAAPAAPQPQAEPAPARSLDLDDELARTLAAIRADDALYDPPAESLAQTPADAPAAASQPNAAEKSAAAKAEETAPQRPFLGVAAARAERLSLVDPVRPAPLELRQSLRVHPADPADDARRARLGDGDASVNRILKETNSQLDDSEASRRRSTIAHLKAAVAATRAERAEPHDPAAADEEIHLYRDDLQRAVRQHRPEASPAARTETSGASGRRLAPLMLISELRVDRKHSDASVAQSGASSPVPQPNAQIAALRSQAASEPAQAGAMSLGRAETTGNLAVSDRAPSLSKPKPAPGSFGEFAEQMGASELPDLLEAAAAYAAYVEGRPHVSRPQLMDWAMSAEGGQASREDGLRAFGTLLRQGRIQKTKRGQFAIAEESRFRPN